MEESCEECRNDRVFTEEMCFNCEKNIDGQVSQEVISELRQFKIKFEKSSWGEFTYDNPLITELLEYLKNTDI